VGHWFKHDKLEDRLRAERPRPSDDLISSIKGDLAEAKPRARRGARPQLRLAGITAALVLGVLAVGGAGFAMTYGADFATGVIHHTFVSHKTFVNTVVLNAANDQYGTTTTQTTTVSSTTTSATTTNSDGAKSTVVKSSSQGSITVAPPTNGAEQTKVTWSPTTFTKPVVIVVDPTPPAAAPKFIGPSAQSVVSITVTDPTTGAVIHQLDAPLEIVFPNAPAGYVPVYSEDGINFRLLSDIGQPPLPSGDQDGFYRVGNDVHIVTRHLTAFAVLYKANYSQSESGRKTATAGSGKFGDPTRIHAGAPKVDVPGTPTASGSNVNFSFFVDEQAAVYVHVLSGSNQPVLGNSSTIRKHKIGGKSRKTFHLVILRPGTIGMNLHVPGVKPGAKVQLTFVDFDGNKVSKTVTIK